jgi:prepilin-type N-terminal cleavage/methylation domain-containing protein
MEIAPFSFLFLLSCESFLEGKRAKRVSTRHNFFVSWYLKLRSLSRGKGFTIIEMMVVVALIGFLSAISVSLITLLFQSNIRAAQSANQQNSIEVFYGFLASKLSYVNASDMGIPVPGDPGEVKADSLASDQMLFTYVDDFDGATCYRIMYIKATDEIRLASYPQRCSTPGNPLRPKRRPNQAVTGDKTSDGFATPDNALFDPALDAQSSSSAVQDEVAAKGVSVYTMAAGIRDGSAYGTDEKDWPLSYPKNRGKYPLEPLALFSYLKSNGEKIEANDGVMNIAGSSTLNSILVQSFTSASADPGQDAIIADRFYEQKFFIGQLCPIAPENISSGGGSSGGSEITNYEELPLLPGVDYTIEATASDADAAFSLQGNDFQTAPGSSALALGSDNTSIDVEKAGIYIISVNLCFANNAADIGAFEVTRGSSVIMESAGSFRGISEPAGGRIGPRCLSAVRTVALAAGSNNALRVIPTEGSATGGSISFIWQSKVSE